MELPPFLLFLLKEQQRKFHTMKDNIKAVCRDISYSVVARRDKSVECYDLPFQILFESGFNCINLVLSSLCSLVRQCHGQVWSYSIRPPSFSSSSSSSPSSPLLLPLLPPSFHWLTLFSSMDRIC